MNFFKAIDSKKKLLTDIIKLNNIQDLDLKEIQDEAKTLLNELNYLKEGLKDMEIYTGEMIDCLTDTDVNLPKNKEEYMMLTHVRLYHIKNRFYLIVDDYCIILYNEYLMKKH